MKQRVNLSLTKNLFKFVRRSHKNVSFYVEKLIVNDLISKQNSVQTQFQSSNFSNPSRPIRYSINGKLYS